MSIEVLSTRGLPFSLMTTTHGLLLVADGECTDLFTYCPERGVMRGLGDFDDRMRMHTPKCLQLFRAPVEDDLRQMKREWERAARENTRSGKAARHVHHSPVKTEPTDDVGKPPSKRKVKE